MIFKEQDRYLILDTFLLYLTSPYKKIRFHILGNGWVGKSIYKTLSYCKDVWSNRTEQGRFQEFDCEIFLHDTRIEKFLLPKISGSSEVCDIVINTAAKTNTLWCESHPEETYFNNDEAVQLLYQKLFAAHLTNKNRRLIFVHVSTGCIFNGIDHPITEDENPNPLIVYSKAKLEAENFLLNRTDYNQNFQLVILRPRMFFHEEFVPHNLIYKIAGYNECIDEPNSMTYLLDFIIAMMKIVNLNDSMENCCVYNVVNGNYSSPYKIAKTVWRHDPKKITPGELFKKHPIKLTNTTLSNKKLMKVYKIPTVNLRVKQVADYMDTMMNVIDKTNVSFNLYPPFDFVKTNFASME